MQEKLTMHKIPVRLISVDGGGHGPKFSEPRNLDMSYIISEIADWFLEHLNN